MLRVRVVLGVEECSSDSGEEIDGATASGIGLVGVESSVSEKLKSMREARFLGEPGASMGIRCEFILLKKVDMVSSPFGLAVVLSCSGRAGVAWPWMGSNIRRILAFGSVISVVVVVVAGKKERQGFVCLLNIHLARDPAYPDHPDMSLRTTLVRTLPRQRVTATLIRGISSQPPSR